VRTPISANAILKYDHLSPEEAIVAAWKEAGASPTWHRACKQEVADCMPLLARAVARLASQ